MDYKVLYRKYRPENFDDLVGQDYIKKVLTNSIINKRISHAYIFAGPRGTGKTSTAKIFAKAINCDNPKGGNPCGKCSSCKAAENSPDVIEIDAASNNGVDEVRRLIENVIIANSELKYKVYIIDEVHMMTNSAFNALLLTLEEPPSNVIFILATTDIQSVPSTIISRCQTFSFRPITDEIIVSRLKEVCQKEKITIEDQALFGIANLSAGGLRDALGYLDQLTSLSDKITIDDVNQNYGGISEKEIGNLVEALESNQLEELIKIIKSIKSRGVDYEIFVKKIVDNLKSKAIKIKFSKELARNLSFDDCLELSLKLIDCVNNNVLNTDVFSLIELHLLNYCQPPQEISLPQTPKIQIEEKIESIVNNSDIEIIKKNRVNNCFVGVSKELKEQANKHWQKYIYYLKQKSKKMYGILMDTEIVAASDGYYILTSKVESSIKIANSNLKLLEQMFAEGVGIKIKIVVLTPKEWIEAANDYKNNKKNKVEYKLLEETTQDDKNENELDELDEIFDTKKIEMV